VPSLLKKEFKVKKRGITLLRFEKGKILVGKKRASPKENEGRKTPKKEKEELHSFRVPGSKGRALPGLPH